MTPETNQLSLHNEPTTEPVLGMIQKVIDSGITEANVAALDKLLGVYERLDDKRAEREFSSAFAEAAIRVAGDSRRNQPHTESRQVPEI